MKKRFFALFLAVALTVGIIPTARAAESTLVEIVPPKYSYSVNDFHDGLALVCQGAKPGFMDTAGRYGFIDTTGKEVIPCKYNWAEDFQDGLAVVCIGNQYQDDGRWGYIDTTGKEVIPCTYSWAESFSEGLAVVATGGSQFSGMAKYGVIDTTGKVVIPCGMYDSVRDFSEGLAAVELNDKWGFVDRSGKMVVPLQYDFAYSFQNGFAEVELNRKWGLIDRTGKEIVPCKYSLIDGDFGEPLIPVSIDEKFELWGFIDKTGKEVTPFKYGINRIDGWTGFHDGLTKVCIGEVFGDGKWGFIDVTGKEVVPCTYDSVEDFSEGLAAVGVDEYSERKWGFIDTEGQVVVPLIYDAVGNFANGIAPVGMHKGLISLVIMGLHGPVPSWGYIDRSGREIIPLKYNHGRISYVSDGLVRIFCVDEGKGPLFYEGEEYGTYLFFDVTGQQVLSLRYSDVGDFCEGFALVQNSLGKYGYIDKTGKEIIPCQYAIAQDVQNGYAKIESGEIGHGPDYKRGLLAVKQATSVLKTATENLQTVKVDGADVSFAMYSPDNGGTNYVRLVDLAVALKGTAGQFNVGYDRKLNKVLLISGEAYKGPSSSAPFHSEMEYEMLREPTYVNGEAKNLEGIRFEYQNGGYTYYKLRDLGEALGFNVGWDNANQRIYIESDKAYDPNN